MYKYCDDFGSTFKPFIQIFFLDQVKIINVLDEEKLNPSNCNKSVNDDKSSFVNSRNDMSSIFNSRYNEMRNNISLNGKEKSYAFKSVIINLNKEVIFIGNESDTYSPIQLLVKNEFNLSNINRNIQAIIIGEYRFPMNLIDKETIMDGYIAIKLRSITTIGYLKLKVEIYEENKPHVKDKIKKRNCQNEIQEQNNLKSIIIDNKIIHFNLLDPQHINNYFFSKESDQTKKGIYSLDKKNTPLLHEN